VTAEEKEELVTRAQTLISRAEAASGSHLKSVWIGNNLLIVAIGGFFRVRVELLNRAANNGRWSTVLQVNSSEEIKWGFESGGQLALSSLREHMVLEDLAGI